MKRNIKQLRVKDSNVARRTRQGGFTLVEMIVVIFIVTIIGAALADFARNVLVLNTNGQNSLVAQLEGRRVLKTMVAELRTAFPSAFGSYPIESVATSSIVFFANVNGGAETERIRYFLDTSTKVIKRGVTSPSGIPAIYETSNEILSTLITDVANGTSTPLFEYFDSSYTGTEPSLAMPVDISRVRLVRINAKIDRDVNRSPTLIYLVSEVTFRNLKDNL